jgi:hypothetical protein
MRDIEKAAGLTVYEPDDVRDPLPIQFRRGGSFADAGRLMPEPSGELIENPLQCRIPADLLQTASAVGGLSEAGFKGNRTAQSAKRKGAKLLQFFIMSASSCPQTTRAGAAPGVYECKRGRVMPVLFLILALAIRPSTR